MKSSASERLGTFFIAVYECREVLDFIRFSELLPMFGWRKEHENLDNESKKYSFVRVRV